MSYESYLEFEEFNLSEYIIDLDLDIVTKTFPISRQTRGDFSRSEPKIYSFIPNKIFKRSNINFSEILNPTQSEPTITQSETNNTTQNISNTSVKNVKKEVKNIVNQIKEEIKNEYINEEKFEFKSNEIKNNFTQILQNKIEESNSLTVNQIQEFDQQLSILNQPNYINHNHLKIIEKTIHNNNEIIKEELKKDIKKQQKYLEDFLSS